MDTPKCDKCGLEITTGAMAAFCPNAMSCEFWPHSDGSPPSDGAELLIAKMWIGNACEQIGLQIDDRERLERERTELRLALETADAEICSLIPYLGDGSFKQRMVDLREHLKPILARALLSRHD